MLASTTISEAIVGLIGALTLLVAAAAKWVVAEVGQLSKRNDKQHSDNLSLLKSIDSRTIAIDEKTDRHGEWIAAHDAVHAERDRMEGGPHGPVPHFRRPAGR